VAPVIADERPLPPWDDVKRENSAWKYLNLGEQVSKLMAKNKDEQDTDSKHLGIEIDTNSDNVITAKERDAFTGSLKYTLNKTSEKNRKEVSYLPKDLKFIFEQVAEKSGSKDGSVTHSQWMAVQANNWKMIWYLPAVFIGVFFVLFLMFGKDPIPAEAGKKE
jgi:hypothetical protein